METNPKLFHKLTYSVFLQFSNINFGDCICVPWIYKCIYAFWRLQLCPPCPAYIYIYIYIYTYIYIYIYVIILTFGGRISSLVREVAVTGVEAMKWNIL